MLALQPGMQSQEDGLAALFARKMNFNPQAEQVAPVFVPPVVEAPKEQPKVVYASAHYTHSAHVARHDQQPPQASAPRPASEPPTSSSSPIEAVLRQHGVDPATISRAQLQLFKRVEDPQKLRLMELWAACPSTGRVDNPTWDWSMTSLDQEELLARKRYQQQQIMMDTSIMSLDGTPITAIQAGDGRWTMSQANADSEPYMLSGYEELARRELLSPNQSSSVPRGFAESFVAVGQGTRASAPAGLGATSATTTRINNPAHADPVYNRGRSSSVLATGWGKREAMEDVYGRLAAQNDGDEEMW
ncbi:hypothetical protein B0T17DRAFT_492726 [Bombardia bombarda]|uniref:Uncharacterized protein n=1 Tax=Bombardia bombarda TaxID=252184 RepID=A0AA39X002_9PEZI|nr:hypothetical protein B0T17DRAFT_492726 [Bombardia bombarda]